MATYHGCVTRIRRRRDPPVVSGPPGRRAARAAPAGLRIPAMDLRNRHGRSSVLDGETYESKSLRLTLVFDVARCGWVVGLASPPLWELGGLETAEELLYSQVLIPAESYERGETDEYLDALLAAHFKRLGLSR